MKYTIDYEIVRYDVNYITPTGKHINGRTFYTEEAVEFLQGLRAVYYEGLNVDEKDYDWIENTLDVLGD